jgi:hypothetical protein
MTSRWALFPPPAGDRLGQILYGDVVVLLTALAFNLHEVQYNGLDESGVFSKYSTLQQVKEDVKELAQRTAEFAEALKQRLNP